MIELLEEIGASRAVPDYVPNEAEIEQIVKKALHRQISDEFVEYSEGFPQLSDRLCLFGFRFSKHQDPAYGSIVYTLSAKICLIYEGGTR